jgi:hypothetical protein
MLTIHFKQENAAFQENGYATETARILRDIAKRIERGQFDGPVFDSNGNRVGDFFTTEQD